MSTKETIKRYFIFCLGLFCNAFGVAFVTKSALGASPIAAIPYSLSLIIPKITMGKFVIAFNILMVIAQWILLKKEANKVILALQAVMAFCFGYFTDFALMIFRDFNPSSYPAKIFFLIVGCLILGLGVFFELIGDVVMLPGNALPKVIAQKTGKQYGTIRVISDILMTAGAAALSLIFFKKLISVREGTIISACLIGNIVTMWTKVLKKFEVFLRNWIEDGRERTE